MLDALVIGMGWMGGLHAATYSRLDGVRLVGVVEPDETRHAALAEEFGVPVHPRAEDALGGVDVVSVCVPDDRHAAAAVPALTAGARVLVEKPLAVTSADARRILRARPDPDALSVGHILRFDPRVVRCRELVRSGELGELWHVEVWRDTTRMVAAAPAQRTSVAWFLGIHDADLVRHVTGLSAARVSALGRSVFSPNIDVAYAGVEYDAGVVGSMENNWTLPDGRPNRALAGLRVVGSRGAAEIDLGHLDLSHTTGTGSVNLDSRNWPSREHYGVANIRTEIEEFVRAARDGGPTPVPGEEGLAAVQVVEAVHASIAAGGSPVEVERGA
ncbi:Gfo/Idh/MocA family protein [Streptomonospora litoralis]|uniref:4,5-dihydroxyphthalate dehydrogenase n=1 Tax=Streptomonospora litoralis TaxID=2498135 RepID=A0A4V0ZJC6_9ACTN|nr:Gfo/Idh/MocA family oxidoreductase [Streptomonospora litoralis]QBI53012.1 Putative 4,5-dihydroxyphthalate dehydrogenase [Streptomonospora litoralis]